MSADKWDALIAWVCVVGLVIYFTVLFNGGFTS